MSKSLATAQTPSREYASRPADERFTSVPSLVADALADKNLSVERTYNLKDLKVTVAGKDDRETLRLLSPKGQGRFTPWSFSQLCRTVGAPTTYLRDVLSPKLAADCLNYGLQESVAGEAANLLVRAANGHPEPIIRACTSESYGRLWDAELYGAITKQIIQTDSKWQLPPVWSGGVAGAYRGDRDSFLIITNGGSIVNDPSLQSGGSSGLSKGRDDLFRGILVRNSEVGCCAVTIETILYRFICGNHLLWGAMTDSTFRRRHFGNHVLRDTVKEISRIAVQWAHASPKRDEAIIKGLIEHEIATTKEAVIDELKAAGLTVEQAKAAYARCEESESVSPRSFWGAVQGVTRLSQESGYQDNRYELDRIAASLLNRGRKLVTV